MYYLRGNPSCLERNFGYKNRPKTNIYIYSETASMEMCAIFPPRKCEKSVLKRIVKKSEIQDFSDQKKND